MGVMLGGPKARQVRVVGDVVISYQYVNNEPAMCIFPKRKRAIRQGAYIICLSTAWKYADPDYLVRASIVALKYMAMDTEPSTVNRLCNIILDNLEDLVKMKPEPEDEQTVIGEGTLLGADNKPIHFELTDGPQSVH
jgi:hypothetical protein